MRSNIVWRLYKIFMLFLMLTSFHAWMFWTFNESLYFWVAVFFVSILFYYVCSNHYCKSNVNIFWFALLIISLFLTALNLNIFGFLGAILPCLVAFFVLILNTKSKEDLLSFIVDSLTVIFFVSSLAWLFHLFGYDLPYFFSEHGNDAKGDELYYFEIHYLYLIDRGFLGGWESLIPRFTSIFIEPGFVGSLVSILLYLRRYKMDKTGIILLITLFLTLSLAGFLISIFGFIYYRYYHTKHKLVLFLSVIALFSLFYITVKTYNGGDNVMNLAFTERMEYDETTGTIAGYSRNTSNNEWFWNTFIKSSDLWFGTSESSSILKTNDIDWKAYVIRFGIVGLFAYILYLFFPFFHLRKNKYQFFGFFIIYVLIFSQTYPLVYSMMYISLYVLGINHIKVDSW